CRRGICRRTALVRQPCRKSIHHRGILRIQNRLAPEGCMSREASVTTPERAYPRAESAAALPDHLHRRWARYGRTADATHFAALIGLVVEDVRVDYCRMRLP